MDRFGEWRAIRAADDEDREPLPVHAPPGSAGVAAPGTEDSSSTVRLAAIVGAGVLAIVGIAIWLSVPTATDSKVELRGAVAPFASPRLNETDLLAASFETGDPEIVVDVQGAVARPGVHRLAKGSRTADAIASAGGYSAKVDIAAAAAALNLAAPLADGAKIHVPALGDTRPAAGVPAPGNGAASAAPGKINVNTASTDELDTLPGIGPVTAGKIISAREQAPFATVDELLTRGVVGPSTLEKIRALISVGP